MPPRRTERVNGMGDNKLSPQQLQALLAFASKKLGVSQEQLARSIQSGNTDGLGLSEENSRRLQELIGNRQTAEELVRSPQAQALLDRLLRGE